MDDHAAECRCIVANTQENLHKLLPAMQDLLLEGMQNSRAEEAVVNLSVHVVGNLVEHFHLINFMAVLDMEIAEFKKKVATLTVEVHRLTDVGEKGENGGGN